MKIEAKIGKKNVTMKFISKKDNRYLISISNKKHIVDISKIGKGIYSVINDNETLLVDLYEESNKKYTVNCKFNSYDVEIIDAETKYKMNREKFSSFDGENTIFAPMPGKIVKVLVKEGDKIKEGETAIIISAMKMESQYKAMKDGVVKKVLVKEEDSVDSNQPLIIIN